MIGADDEAELEKDGYLGVLVGERVWGKEGVEVEERKAEGVLEGERLSRRAVDDGEEVIDWVPPFAREALGKAVRESEGGGVEDGEVWADRETDGEGDTVSGAEGDERGERDALEAVGVRVVVAVTTPETVKLAEDVGGMLLPDAP